MHVTPYARALIAGLSLAVLAGCASTSTSRDTQSTQDAQRDGARQGTYDNLDSGVTVNGISGNQISASPFGSDKPRNQEWIDGQAPEQRTIYFGYDSDRIGSEFAEVLYDHATFLKDNGDVHIDLHGHTDNRGTREYNLALGERRALSVKRFLIMLDVPEEQMEVVSYGEERPAVRGSNEDAYAQNRRVILTY